MKEKNIFLPVVEDTQYQEQEPLILKGFNKESHARVPEVAPFRGSQFDLQGTQYVEKTPIDNLNRIHSKDAEGNDMVTFVSDVTLLFDQKRLDNTLGSDNIRKWIASMAPRTSPYVNKFDDDALLQFVKDRNIQTPSEIRAWSQYLIDVAASMETPPPPSAVDTSEQQQELPLTE